MGYVIVKEMYGNEREFVIKKNSVRKGFFFNIQDDVFCDADVEVFEKYIAQKEEEEGYSRFIDYLDNLGIDYKELPTEGNTEESEVEKWSKEWKYYYDSNFESYDLAENALNFETVYYFEYWDGSNHKQIDIEENSIEDIELIDSDIEFSKNNKTYQYDLYKNNDGELFLVYNSYYQGELDIVEERITSEELEERFDYTVQPEFNADKMKKFLKNDRSALKMFNDLKDRNASSTEEDILEVVFNSFILEDSYCSSEYNKL